ncbi:hypothetical protein [Methylobacterium sp. MA0201]|uniref:hypothetical protein n=1 Tax=Methylobacterium alsaeris TaxID=3344826 RepID=UPI00375825C2
MVDDLSLRDEPDVDLALARNLSAPLAGAALERLVERARRRPELAALLLARDDLPAVDLAPLYLQADRTRRAAIRDGVAARAALRPQARAGMRAAGAALTAFAGRGEPERFEAALGEALGMPGVSFRATEPERRDLLALALRAADLAEEEAVFIFLRLDPSIARSVEAVFGLTELFRAMDAATARDLVASILGSEPGMRSAAPEQHRPAHGPSSPRIRPAAAPALRQTLPERTRKTR